MFGEIILYESMFCLLVVEKYIGLLAFIVCTCLSFYSESSWIVKAVD